MLLVEEDVLGLVLVDCVVVVVGILLGPPFAATEIKDSMFSLILQ